MTNFKIHCHNVCIAQLEQQRQDLRDVFSQVEDTLLGEQVDSLNALDDLLSDLISTATKED